MADTSLPSYAKLGWRDTGETPDPVVLRSEKERGVPSQRRMKADSLVAVDVTLYFDSSADAVSFESWFFGDLAGGANWFDWTNPRTGNVVEARIVGGDMGKLVPTNPTWGWAQRSMRFEYIRRGFEVLPVGRHDVKLARVLSAQRNSTATYLDYLWTLQTAGAHAARIDRGRVNLLLNSSDMTSTHWNGPASRVESARVYGNSKVFRVAKQLAASSEHTTHTQVNVTAGQLLTATIVLFSGDNASSAGFGLNSTADGWGPSGDPDLVKQIVSGPGTLSAPLGNNAYTSVVGLSNTVPTVLRITRKFLADAGAKVIVYPGTFASTTVGHDVLVTEPNMVLGAVALLYEPTGPGIGKLLVEPARTNLLPNSNDFASWNPVSISGGVATSGVADPFGGTLATTLTATADGMLYQNSGTVAAGNTLIASCWIRRRAGTGVIGMRCGDGTSYPIPVTSAWQRLSVSALTVGTIARWAITAQYTGDAVDVFGAQIEIGVDATSYIPTTTAAVTREADLITVAA